MMTFGKTHCLKLGKHAVIRISGSIIKLVKVSLGGFRYELSTNPRHPKRVVSTLGYTTPCQIMKCERGHQNFWVNYQVGKSKLKWI